VGDSRAYRLRDGEFLQLSVDHVEKRPGREHRKAPLTQYLGFGSDEILLEPHIAKGMIKRDDLYLLCSDGLTDMLSNFEISDIMINNPEPETCVKKLIDAALEHGGRDNVTAIVCRLV
jgi:protein phosphatase